MIVVKLDRPRTPEKVESVRQELATLLRVDPSEVVILPEGITVLGCLPLPGGAAQKSTAAPPAAPPKEAKPSGRKPNPPAAGLQESAEGNKS